MLVPRSSSRLYTFLSYPFICKCREYYWFFITNFIFYTQNNLCIHYIICIQKNQQK